MQVLDSVSLQVEDASVVSITGASGAGKTTLLQIMGSLDRPDAGRVLIGDTDIYALSAKRLSEFRNTRIGFVFQFHYLLPEFTALENVMMPALIGGKERRQAETDAADLLDFLGLSARMSHKPSELSGGEQQRVAVARALVNRPEVVFADEPSGNLDSVTKKDLHNLFFRLRDKLGQTIVIVTHDPELSAMCDRSLFMRDGLFVDNG